MKYRLLASDIDGTLLNDQKEISRATIEAINKLHQSNIVFVLATGRSPLGIEKITKYFDFEIPCICYNGALVLNSLTGDIIFEQKIKTIDAIQIINFLDSHNYNFVVWIDKQIYASSLNDDVITYANKYQTTPHIVSDYTTVASRGIHKILVASENSKVIDKLQSQLDKQSFVELDYYPSSPNYLEIVSSKASKGIGLMHISKRFNIHHDEIIVIGDSFNDISMFEYAGLSIAMKNAPDKVKEKAHELSDDNNNDGVRKVIEKHFLK